MHWKRWAEGALKLVKAQDPVDLDAVRALEYVLETGHEPYYTLKALVHQLRDGESEKCT